MPRKLRIQYSGALYHVMNRGDRREPICRSDKDRELFLSTLEEACAKTEWQVHAYCLMGNHFHLVIETPQPNLVSGMKWLLGVYTKRFNIRHKLCGHLFAGRYKALLVDGSGNGYLQTVCDYVHLNPVRAKLLNPEQPLETFKWSSYPGYLQPPKKRPGWLRVDRLLGEKGIPEDTPAARIHFSRLMELRRKAEARQKHEELRRGWYIGSDAFRRELLELAGQKVGANHFGGERQETGEQKAERIVQEEMQRMRCTEPELLARRKGDKEKVPIARRLRKESTMSYKWIAERLRMGAWSYVWNLVAAQQSHKLQSSKECKK